MSKSSIECPRYSAALSDMYKSFPFWVSIMRKPERACDLFLYFSEEREEECREFKSEKRKINALFELFFESTTQKKTNSIHSIPRTRNCIWDHFQICIGVIMMCWSPKNSLCFHFHPPNNEQLLFNSQLFPHIFRPSRRRLVFCYHLCSLNIVPRMKYIDHGIIKHKWQIFFRMKRTTQHTQHTTEQERKKHSRIVTGH